MITIQNTTTIPEIVAAVANANALLRDQHFFDTIKAHPSFDMADVIPAQVAQLLQDSTIVMTVEMYESDNRRVFGYDDPSHPQVIHINSKRNLFTVPALTNTMIHETLHAVNNLNPQYKFGHGGNSSRGKQNTAPYWIGNLAEKLVCGSGDEPPMQVHEGSPEAFSGIS